ncbi:hypothetical protein L1987_70125 [Smallanthus sonchifolius]|uniref:Uncharacterized protein n=1 Tax=Smallanthus sonchifolius TaxID=185202 RepID=A0ACB9APA2_9ASTR|nr:hypothetical protein L1987_70125 [Smallanthus sonchifolius]
MVVRSADTSQTLAFDFRETAPLAASENMYENNLEAKYKEHCQWVFQERYPAFIKLGQYTGGYLGKHCLIQPSGSRKMGSWLHLILLVKFQAMKIK